MGTRTMTRQALMTEGAVLAATVEASKAETNVMPLPEIWAADKIKKDQDGIRVSLLKTDDAIHANAVQCIMHAEKHGDTSLMKRLLVDIVDAKTGYRRQGLIAWMREFTPMELHGETIKLTGTINGERKPWQVAKANATRFTELSSAKEFVALRPVFKDNLTSRIDKAVKDYRASTANSKIENGKIVGPKDAKKPFYNGLHLDKMEEAFEEIGKIMARIEALNDPTKDKYEADVAVRRANVALEEASKVKAD
jgi:hypothetical protein